MPAPRLLLTSASLLAAWLADAVVAEDKDGPVDFTADVRPLLSDRCFPCHGPGVLEPSAGLRLDQRDSAVDELGLSAIVPGAPGESELVARLRHPDPERRMPPASSKLALDDDEAALLTRWIEEGAEYGEHWSFVPPRRSTPPLQSESDWPRDDIDRFVLGRLEGRGLSPAPEADAATLLRRVHLDLTGLPPRIADLDAYLEDEGPDRYEQAVDRLLASEAHAEHLTAHWLDVARYADTFGYQSDVDTHLWPWRDWVIGAFRENLPYDRFLTEQLAGDLLPDADQQTRLATAFNRLHRQTNEGGSVEEEFRVEYVCDRVETMAGAFLGLTVGCARCHDHKFDPITQRDYFGLFALFDGIDESGLYSHFTNATPTPTLELPTEVQARRTAELEQRTAAALDAASGDEIPWREVFTTRFEGAGEEGAPFQLRGGAAVTGEGPGRSVALDGENSIVFPGMGVFRRADPFRIELEMRSPEPFDRAVVLHRTKSWTDSGSRGYQLLVDEGRLLFALVHFWPGDAIAVRTVDAAPVDRWTTVELRYDGSSRAAGMEIWIDGEPAPLEVVRDHLTRTIRGGSIEHLTIGSRFRDRGFKGGAVRSMRVMDLPPEVPSPTNTLRAARAALDDHRDRIRLIMTMREAPELPAAQRTAYLLERGLYSNRREPVAPATPAFLPALLDEPVRSRLDLARWLTHPDHPLTARVHVDRLWRLAMGQGLVPSPEDLGSQSRPPIRAALLDTLSRDLVESGWYSRALLRRIVLSSTYRQASDHAGSLDRDPDNGLLSRASARRMGAEVIRDAALEAAGLLVHRVGGPPVRPYQPTGLWQEKSGKVYRAGRGDDLRRRSLYTFWRRTSPPPAMTMFDAPAREVCRVDRPATTTPLQALVLWNDPQFVEASLALARLALVAEAQESREPTEPSVAELDRRRVAFLVRSLASRPPTAEETEAMTALIEAQREAYRLDPDAARRLANFSLERAAHPGDEAPEPEPMTDEVAVETAATTVVASALLGLPDVVQRR